MEWPFVENVKCERDILAFVMFDKTFNAHWCVLQIFSVA